MAWSFCHQTSLGSLPLSSLIDLRSDTVTLPTAEMRKFIFEASLGDDVFGEDPTILQLEEETARLLGHEAAVFMPSGTMSNQIAIRAHTQPGDELLCEENAHIFVWEAGGPAIHSGVTCRTVPGRAGILSLEDLEGKIRPQNDHYTRSRLVCLENTHNRGGGSVFPLSEIRRIGNWAREKGLGYHLDGARMWNASVALGVKPAEIAREFDTVSVCFSKGLGAPVGSALVGPKDFVKRARKLRKVFGGGLRQAGIIGAGALYAIRNNISRLAEDHSNAQLIANVVRNSSRLELDPDCVDTNLVWFRVKPGQENSVVLASRLKAEGVLVSSPLPGLLRACTHLNVNRDDCKKAAAILEKLANSLT